MIRRSGLISFLAAVILISMQYSVFADQQSDSVEIVDKAVESFQSKGKDYTLKLINTMSGPFRKGEVYVFAISLDGIMLAHAANKDLVGINQNDMKDGKGNLIFPPMIEIAKKQGTGWTEYWWVRHGEKEPTMKRTYIKRVPGQDLLVGAGYYIK